VNHVTSQDHVRGLEVRFPFDAVRSASLRRLRSRLIDLGCVMVSLAAAGAIALITQSTMEASSAAGVRSVQAPVQWTPPRT
jgi:hypothetical protein